MHDKKIIIEGVSHNGEVFRPSDWAERLSGKLCKVTDKRLCYSPLLKPGRVNGTSCVFIDVELQKTEPELFRELMDFAKKNKLVICNEDQIAAAKKNDQSPL